MTGELTESIIRRFIEDKRETLMYAVVNGTKVLGIYPSRDEAVEAAQEDLRLPPDGPWTVVPVGEVAKITTRT